MRIGAIILAVVLALGAFIGASAVYTVSEVEQAIITQFGKPVGEPVTTAGLKLKVPFIQEVNPIDRRVLEWDGNPSDMPTKDKLYISVDLFARWRITDPLPYFERLRDERSAQSRLDDFIGSENPRRRRPHDLIESRPLHKERIRPRRFADGGRRADIGALPPIRRAASASRRRSSRRPAKGAGLRIELIDVRFKRINYNAGVRPKIYDRMSRAHQIAERFLSEGNGEAAQIRGIACATSARSSRRRTGRWRRKFVDLRTQRRPRSMPAPTTAVLRPWSSTNSRARCRPTRR